MDRLAAMLHQCADSALQGVIALAVGLLIFSVLERSFAFGPERKSGRATWLDLQYALLSMFYPPFIYFILAAIFGFLALHLQDTPHNPGLSPLRFAGQLFIVLLLRDGLIYLRHRVFHLRPVWKFHSIHHSSEEVNWLSAVRFHPAENLIEAAGETLLFLGCAMGGFDPAVLAVAAIVIGFYNFFIHSNLRWTFGPLRYVLVSPVFHRWHHSDEAAALDKNFAAMFSFLDLALGTFYMPANSRPETVGLVGPEKTIHPRTFVGQLLYPFRKR